MTDPETRHTVEKLLGEIALGNRDSFDTLYAMTNAKLLGVALHILKDREQAEDVLQESYVKVWRKADMYRPGPASPMSWLICVVRNTAIDRYRQRQMVPLHDTAFEEVPDTAASPEDVAAARSSGSKLGECLGQIEGRKAALIKAAYFSGRTYAELATVTKTPVNTLKTWVRRSLMVLKACIETKPAAGARR